MARPRGQPDTPLLGFQKVLAIVAFRKTETLGEAYENVSGIH